METTGLKKLNNGSYVCEKCDNYLFKTMLHLDYEDKAVTTYKCECGAIISTTIERNWGIDEKTEVKTNRRVKK